ncbi:SapB/AmfS family lanthipeptide [Actinoplanes sp. RD1]|nr:SapB/AmfS family lanthipeptide [Actinoplanes sp. RD1]
MEDILDLQLLEPEETEADGMELSQLSVGAECGMSNVSLLLC